jgi:hypothetical protein
LGFGGGWPFLLFDGDNYDFVGFAAVGNFGWGGGGLVGVLVFGAQPADQVVLLIPTVIQSFLPNNG